MVMGVIQLDGCVQHYIVRMDYVLNALVRSYVTYSFNDFAHYCKALPNDLHFIDIRGIEL